jgi:hypothetical protein
MCRSLGVGDALTRAFPTSQGKPVMTPASMMNIGRQGYSLLSVRGCRFTPG